ncbi:hypothetical protein [Marinifilum flexuosum]|uniref:hypothetical protein n=1 Tax=Marinifilum flexuosum TaxID=1117708 RepID=UPI002493DBB2|nr:hypothetical protein [Marinifilum flexuosum]
MRSSPLGLLFLYKCTSPQTFILHLTPTLSLRRGSWLLLNSWHMVCLLFSFSSRACPENREEGPDRGMRGNTFDIEFQNHLTPSLEITPHTNPLFKERELAAAEFLTYDLFVVFLLL